MRIQVHRKSTGLRLFKMRPIELFEAVRHCGSLSR
jgi:hypothetical protein